MEEEDDGEFHYVPQPKRIKARYRCIKIEENGVSIPEPFTTDELLLLRHLLVQAQQAKLLQDEAWFVVDVDAFDQIYAIRDSALAKVRKLLGVERRKEEEP